MLPGTRAGFDELIEVACEVCERGVTAISGWPELKRQRLGDIFLNDEDKSKLRLKSLHERHSGLTPSLSGTFYEAASVCLNRQPGTHWQFVRDYGMFDRRAAPRK